MSNSISSAIAITTRKILEITILLSTIDGKIQKEEVELIDRIETELLGIIQSEKISSDTYLEIGKEIFFKDDDEKLHLLDINSRYLLNALPDEDRKNVLNFFMSLVLADNNIAPKEKAYIKILEKGLFPPAHVNNHEGYRLTAILFGIALLFALSSIKYGQIPIVISILLILFALCDQFLADRCPNCKTKEIFIAETRELDRWVGRKNVTERTAKGKTRTKNVRTTFVTIQRHYKCSKCNNDWFEVSDEEK